MPAAAFVRPHPGRQALTTVLGASLAHRSSGEVDLRLPFSPAFRQQNGYFHAGAIAEFLACGRVVRPGRTLTVLPGGGGIEAGMRPLPGRSQRACRLPRAPTAGRRRVAERDTVEEVCGLLDPDRLLQ